MHVHLLTRDVACSLCAITPLHMLVRALVRVLLTDLVISSRILSDELLFFIAVYLRWSSTASAIAQKCDVKQSVVAHQKHDFPGTAHSGSVAHSILTHCIVLLEHL